jgi:hypothetical protein
VRMCYLNIFTEVLHITHLLHTQRETYTHTDIHTHTYTHTRAHLVLQPERSRVCVCQPLERSTRLQIPRTPLATHVHADAHNRM